MSVTEGTVDIGVPVGTAYDQWSQFDSFPRFMDSVVRVDKPQVTLSHWVVRIGRVTREFDAKVEEQHPDELLSWRSLHAPHHEGTVRFAPLGERRCRVRYRLEFVPHGPLDRAADASGLVRRHVHTSLRDFKEYIEAQGVASGRWRGSVRCGLVEPHPDHTARPVPHWPTG